ncbi:MAG TPA: ATP-binding protein, partial [Vicinamibacterales bacterium]|nr:ATP-binding protein [Vicinamibacterales bacterium]
AAERVFGYDREDVIGRDMLALLLPERYRAAFRAGLTGPSASVPGRFRLSDREALQALRADGLEFPIELSIARIEDSGAPWHAAFIRDITVQQATERQLRNRATVAQLSADVGLALTRSGILSDALQQCMQAAVDRLGCRLARVWILDEESGELRLGASAGLDDAVERHVLGPLSQQLIAQIATECRPHFTNEIQTDPRVDRDWAVREGLVSFAGLPLLVGETIVGVVAVFSAREVSDVDYESLAALARKLSLGIARQRGVDALRQRAAELTRSTRALERSNRDLDQFAYITSHDLKAPLRGIANLADWIEEDLGEIADESVRAHLALLRGRVLRMDRLIDGILEYSRAGRGAAFEQVETAALVAEAIDLLSPPPEARIVVAPDLPPVRAPRLPLQQVFLNLIGNALKYAQRPDPLVEVSAVRVPGGVQFRVVDNGPGIAPQYHARIWGVFQRLHARDDVEGTGIGLALVKRIVDAAGGEVGIDSDEGRGATFYFTWPLSPAGEALP